MHRGHRTLQFVSLGGIAAALAFLVFIRLGWVALSGRRSVAVVLVLVLFSNVFWWSRVREVIHRSTAIPTKGLRLAAACLWNTHALLVLLPLVLVGMKLRHTVDALPVPILAWTIIWHLLLAGVGIAAVAVVGLRGAGWVLRAARARAQAVSPAPAVEDTGGELQRAGLSRRELLSAATAAAPLVITGGSLVAGAHQAGGFRVRKITMHVPGLPSRLEGLTITHISDAHVGRFFRPEHLPRMVEEANRLKSDLVVVTGDMIDHSNDFLPAAVEALAQLEAPYGRFTVIGNHDLFDDPIEVIRALRTGAPRFLDDAMTVTDVGGEPIQIAGLFWSASEPPRGRDPGLIERARQAMAGASRERFTIALTHHPHAFDALAHMGANLVLAGHTHGGQIMLTPPGWPVTFGAGSLMFRYIHGEYALGQARLYVNSGVGNWFPVRVNAPAEIVQLRLV